METKKSYEFSKFFNSFVLALMFMLLFWAVARPKENRAPERAVVPPPQKPIIGRDVELARVGIYGNKSEFGFVRVTLAGGIGNYRFLNIVADLNNDGEFREYDFGYAVQTEWLVKNMPVYLGEEKNAFAFYFPDGAAEETAPETGIKLRAMLTREALETGEWDGSSETDAVRAETATKILFEDIGGRQSPDWGKDGAIGFLYKDGYPRFLPAARADSGEAKAAVYQAGVPDIDQADDECAPAAITNSLLWLADKYGFKDKIPQTDALLSGIKTDMSWHNGVWPVNFFPGAAAAVERFKLPAIVHQLGDNRGLTTFDKIYEALKSGERAELRLQYRRVDGTALNGHWVSVIGAELMPDGTPVLGVHDPLSPRALDIYRLDRTGYGITVVNYPYGRAYLSYAVVTSYSPATEEEMDAAPLIPPAAVEKTKVAPPTALEESAGDITTISVFPRVFRFEHRIGSMECPRAIGRVEISSAGKSAATKWQLMSERPAWMNIAGLGPIPGSLNVDFNCLLNDYIAQTLAAEVVIQPLTATGDPVGAPQTIRITGNIIKE